MIKLERCNVMNFENAIRGARNPLNSWGRMDSSIVDGKFVFGPNDLDLAKRLCKAGSDHRKFIRQIFITVDITAPLYWWKEYDTYKVGTVANSTSTMHKIVNSLRICVSSIMIQRIRLSGTALYSFFLRVIIR